MTLRPVAGESRPGGWTDETEVNYLNGEIALPGRLQGVAVPGNTVVRRLAADLAGAGEPRGSKPVDDVFAGIGAER